MIQASGTQDHVEIVELGPRDGLQNEQSLVTLDAKVSLVERLADAGCRTIEVGSFVSPKWVPQMANTVSVFERIRRHEGVSYLALTPSAAQLDQALAARATAVAVFPATTESFCNRNLNASCAKAIARSKEVARLSLRAGLKVRGYVSCAVHCPFEGWIAPARTAELAADLMDMGCYEVSLCDTTGVGTPNRARAIVEAVATRIPLSAVAVHFHDTYGQALVNAATCFNLGVRTFDAAVAGLGGCPFAPGAAGNLATEDLVYMLAGLGVHTGIDLRKLASAGSSITTQLGRTSTSRVAAALSSGSDCLAK